MRRCFIKRARWAVLISGRGSNLAAVLELRDQIDVRLVISSSPAAYGLLRAKRAGVRGEIVPFVGDGGAKKRIDWPRLTARLREAEVSHVFLAGFMKVVPAMFVEAWRGRIVNLHPSLLPAYPGLNSIQRAIGERARVGVTVHEVNEEVDAGKVIYQRLSLVPKDLEKLSPETCEFLAHVDEQRLVKECLSRWPN